MTVVRLTYHHFQSRKDRNDRLLRHVEEMVGRLEEVVVDGQRVVAELRAERLREGSSDAGTAGDGGKGTDRGGPWTQGGGPRGA